MDKGVGFTYDLWTGPEERGRDLLETAVYWAFIFSAFLAIGQFVAEVRPLHTREKISIHHRGLKHHFTVQHRAA